MAHRKLPPAAFEYYYSLGTGRSYMAVAKEFKVSKPTVVSMAKHEGWQSKLRERDTKTAAEVAKRGEETIEAMHERHLKTLKVIQGKALEALRVLPMTNASQAAHALLAAVLKERDMRMDAGNGGMVDIEAIIKREYETWMQPDTDEGWDRLAERSKK